MIAEEPDNKHLQQEIPMERSIILQAEISEVQPPASHPSYVSNHSNRESQVQQYQPREQVRPLPRAQQHTVHVPEQTDTDFFGLFDCCRNVKVEPDLYVSRVDVERSRAVERRKKDEPYMSEIRMKNRQNQPINIYHDHLVSEKLSNSRWTYL